MKKLTEKQILIREIPLVLLSFLLKRKLLHKYCNNVLRNPYELCQVSERSLISNAFRWYETQEGYTFWREINEDYEKLFK